MKRYLVTGGAGFIGSHIVEALVRKGQRVRVLDDFSSGRREFLKSCLRDIEIQKGSIARFADCQKAVKGVDIVIHQAALRSVAKSVMDPFAYHETDATGTLNMLEAARRARVKRFVNASSSSVYGNVDHFPMRETEPTRPLSPYGTAKLAAELYAWTYYLNYGFETVSLRYFNVFGPRQNPESVYSTVVPAFIERLKKNKRPIIHGTGRQSRDFTYVENVVNANLLAATAPGAKGRIFNIANGRDFSVIDVYETLARITGKRHIKPEFQKRRPADPDKTYADISQAKRFLGWKPTVGFKEGLKRTVEWFQ
jgi:UDP-glucose 4-epimerase